MHDELREIKRNLNSILSKDVEETITEITKLLSKNSRYNDELTHIKSRNNELKLDKIKGIVSREDYSLERRSIVESLNLVIDAFEEEDLVVFGKSASENRVAYENEMYESLMREYVELKKYLEGYYSSFYCSVIDGAETQLEVDFFLERATIKFWDFKLKIVGSYLKIRFDQEVLKEMTKIHGDRREQFVTKVKGFREYRFDIRDMNVDEIRIEHAGTGDSFYLVIDCKDLLEKVSMIKFVKENRVTDDVQKGNWAVLGAENESAEEKVSSVWLAANSKSFLDDFRDKLTNFHRVCQKVL